MTKRRLLKILYLIVGALTVFEFIFVRGMFTWLIAVISISVIGLLNVLSSLKVKNYNEVSLYLLATLALVMGYFIILSM